MRGVRVRGGFGAAFGFFDGAIDEEATGSPVADSSMMLGGGEGRLASASAGSVGAERSAGTLSEGTAASVGASVVGVVGGGVRSPSASTPPPITATPTTAA